MREKMMKRSMPMNAKQKAITNPLNIFSAHPEIGDVSRDEVDVINVQSSENFYYWFILNQERGQAFS